MPVIAVTPRSPAQQRVIDKALELIARYGVSGTSLQMIADALGVTKAAVYHQFRTKEDIVLAAVEAPMRDISTLVEQAGQVGSDAARAEVLIDGFIDLVVQHRRTVGSLQGDPTMVQVVTDHEPYAAVIEGLRAHLTGGSDEPAAVIRSGMLWNAIMATGAQASLAEVDAEVLRRHLREGARRLVGLQD
jgi:AcrR family transcriptional regulator